MFNDTPAQKINRLLGVKETFLTNVMDSCKNFCILHNITSTR